MLLTVVMLVAEAMLGYPDNYCIESVNPNGELGNCGSGDSCGNIKYFDRSVEQQTKLQVVITMVGGVIIDTLIAI